MPNPRLAQPRYIVDADGTIYSVSNPLPVSSTVGGAVVSTTNPLPTSGDDFHLEIAKGLVTGHKIVHKFGRNADSSSGDDVWFADGGMNWETAAAVVSILSADVNDDGNPTTNTGAQTVTIEGLDASFNEQTTTVTLNGTSAVTTGADTYIRVNRAFVATNGTYHETNIGNLTATINGNTTFVIEADIGQTQLGRYTVPNGKTAYLTKVVVAVASDKTASIEFFQMPNADDITQPFSGAKRLFLEFDGVSGEELFEADGGVKFEQKTDIWAHVRNVSGAAVPIDVEMELIVVDN